MDFVSREAPGVSLSFVDLSLFTEGISKIFGVNDANEAARTVSYNNSGMKSNDLRSFILDWIVSKNCIECYEFCLKHIERVSKEDEFEMMVTKFHNELYQLYNEKDHSQLQEKILEKTQNMLINNGKFILLDGSLLSQERH